MTANAILAAIRDRITELNTEAGCRLFYLSHEGERLCLHRRLDGDNKIIKKSRKSAWALRGLLHRLQAIQIIFI